MGDSVGAGSSTQVPLSSVRPLGQVQTGPLGLSRHSHSHFFLSQGLVTGSQGETRNNNKDSLIFGLIYDVIMVNNLFAASKNVYKTAF